MFFLYHHHDLDRLAELLAVLLARREREHALQPDTVIVPNRGVGRWLQMRLAESEGVAANLQLPLPARFIWQLIPRALPGRPDSSEFERTRLRWHLYAVLPEAARRSPEVAHYLTGEPRDLHRLQLADRLADVFDQYLIYRPGLLADWEAKREREVSPDRWQAEVWRTLTARLGTEHRAALLQRFVDGLADGTMESASLPGPVYCFGLGQLPPEYVKFLYALGRRVDVHFLLPNPCEGYWGDIAARRIRIEDPLDETPSAEEMTVVESHPLLGSLGVATRDLLRVLYADELAGIQEPELGEALAYEPPAQETLLARVQGDIIRMAAAREHVAMADGDASIQVHACHSPLREVQVLQDQLLDLLARDPGLNPRDIVVMLPDVTAYAPAIHSVFGAAEGERHLPYTLSDRARHAGHPIAASFRRLIDLPLSRWTASEVLELAAVPAVMRRFALDEAALRNARDWAQAAGVRWGFDEDTRARFGAAALAQNTWRFGLDRLLLGLAQSDDEALVDGVAPWAGLEGAGAAAAVGGLWHLVDRLRTWDEALREPASAHAWQDRLNALTEDLFAPDAAERGEADALAEVREALAVLGEAGACLDDEPLSREAVREILVAELGAPGERQPFLSGGVTFCGLVPLRAVPFSVVCLLGMNDEAFPRQERNRAFNVLRRRPQLGDHNARDDDRLLFLQALTAARRVFYVSYVGQDMSSGDVLAPSAVVGEWLEFLYRHYFAGVDRKVFEARLIARQPMHPFSERYFQKIPEHPRLFTFARAWQPAASAGKRARIAAPAFVDGARAAPADTGSVEISELRRFFDHPAQYFLRERLHVHLDALEEGVDDVEPLALDNLAKYQLRDALMAQAQARGNAAVPTQPDALWRARGLLPPPPLDISAFAEQAGQVNALLPVWRTWAQDGEPGWVDIDLDVDGTRLVGRLSSVWPDGPRRLRPGSLGLKYRLRAWIDYLVYRAAGHPGRLRLAGLDKESAIEQVAELDAADACEQLAKLLDLFRQGQQAPLLFLPSLADTYLGHLEKGKTHEYALDKTNERVTPSANRGGDREAADPYFRLLLDGEPPLGAEPGDTAFCELAEAVGGPPLAALQPAQAPP